MNRQSELLKNIDWLSIFLYTLLVFMGWLNIYAAVYDESHSNILDIDLKYGKQLLWIGAAFVLGIFILLTDSKFFTAFSFVIYGLTVGLLAAVLVFGVESHGARSWFEIGGIRIQPAEFGKFATCLAIANVMSRHGFKIMRFSSLALIGLLLAMILVSPMATPLTPSVPMKLGSPALTITSAFSNPNARVANIPRISAGRNGTSRIYNAAKITGDKDSIAPLDISVSPMDRIKVSPKASTLSVAID